MKVDPRTLRCLLIVLIAIFNGGYFGGLAGLIFAGPLGILFGVIFGGAIGLIVGGLICWLVEVLTRPGFTIPKLKATLTASPNPVKSGQSCGLNLSFTFTGNTDGALCTITAQINAPGGSPNTSQLPIPYTNNGPDGGSALFVSTQWTLPAEAHSQTVVVTGTVVLTATKGGKTVVIADTASVTVTVTP